MNKFYSNIILFLILIAPVLAVSQDTGLASAIALFDKGKFAEAEPIFKTVLDEKPNDFMVNYFYGACRTENNHFTNADLECLITANEEVSPININYYFGVQYHARSNWERALKYYNRYKSAAQPDDISKRKVLEKIQQCYDKVNPYETYIVKENTIPVIPVVETDSLAALADTAGNALVADSLAADMEPVVDTTAQVASATTETPEKPKGKAISFIVNIEITYTNTNQFRTTDGKAFFEEWRMKKHVLDSMISETDALREKYAKAKTRFEKNSVGQQILENEKSFYKLKDDVAELQSKAQSTENNYWQNASPEEIATFLEEQKKEEQKAMLPDTTTVNTSETDSTESVNAVVLLSDSDEAAVKDESGNNNLVYKIQLGTYRKLPNYVKKLYTKLSLFRKIDTYTDEKGVVVYTTGNLSSYDDALKMQNQVKQEGVEDAKIVPYFKGKRITLKEAKKLEEKG